MTFIGRPRVAKRRSARPRLRRLPPSSSRRRRARELIPPTPTIETGGPAGPGAPRGKRQPAVVHRAERHGPDRRAGKSAAGRPRAEPVGPVLRVDRHAEQRVHQHERLGSCTRVRRRRSRPGRPRSGSASPKAAHRHADAASTASAVADRECANIRLRSSRFGQLTFTSTATTPSAPASIWAARSNCSTVLPQMLATTVAPLSLSFGSSLATPALHSRSLQADRVEQTARCLAEPRRRDCRSMASRRATW